jgi:hypothetical protein
VLDDLEGLYASTTISTWATDEVIFSDHKKVVVKLFEEIYKGNAVLKTVKFDDDSQSGGHIVYRSLPNGNRDPRNHKTCFKSDLAVYIKALKGCRLEIATTSLFKLRWTQKSWPKALRGLITVLLVTIAKEIPAIIKALKSK